MPAAGGFVTGPHPYAAGQEVVHRGVLEGGQGGEFGAQGGSLGLDGVPDRCLPAVQASGKAR